jgi:glycosyltransferase involved in cell wall biosynthesis
LVSSHGWLPRPDLNQFYAKSHIALHPSNSEGWPKVLSEAMAYGVVPIASNVGSIPHYLQKFGVGKTFDANDIEGFANAVMWYVQHPDAWKEESENGVKAAHFFSYENYLRAVRGMLDLG